MPIPSSKTMCRARRLAAIGGALALFAAVPVHAQLGLPGPGATVGVLPGAVDVLRDPVGTIGSGPVQAAQRSAVPVVTLPVDELRRRNIDTLLRQHADRLETDPAGEPVLRSELVLISPAPDLLTAAYALGYRLLRVQALEGLELRSVVLQAPPGMATAAALERLRALDTRLEADFNHVYLRGGSADAAAPTGRALAAASGVGPAAPPAASARRVGLIDSGVDLTHPALRASTHRVWGCDDRPVPSPHGTAVASLLVGRDAGFRGALPGAMLYAADVYCGSAPGGGSADAVAQALAWMARERVAVINLSLVGAPNRLLELAVRSLVERGHLVVAAVGNDGPAAPPLYPAAYPGVVGVTGITSRRQVLPEAAQGRQVVFAAPGAEVAVARSAARDYVAARGTSFAAPLVAGLLADLLPEPDPTQARAALQALVQRAVDLGLPGRDTVYGHGLVGEAPRLQFASHN